MTAVLVKDGNYLWARRTSKRDQQGVYLDAYMEDYLNDGDLMRTEALNEEKVHQEQDAGKHGWWENKGEKTAVYNGESGRLQVSEKEIPGMRRMNW